MAAAVAEPSPLPAECESTGKPAAQFEPGEALRDWRQPDGARRPVAQPKLAPKESPIVAWLTGAAVKQAIAKAARSLAEGKSEDVIAQVGSLVEENALLKSDNAVLRNEIVSLAKRLDKVRDELDAIKRAVARGLNKEDFEFSSHRSIIDEIVGKGYGHTDSGHIGRSPTSGSPVKCGVGLALVINVKWTTARLSSGTACTSMSRSARTAAIVALRNNAH